MPTSPDALPTSRRVTVEQVLPATGLAYVADDAQSWAITRSTPGIGLDQLQVGQALEITLARLGDAEVISAYAPLAN